MVILRKPMVLLVDVLGALLLSIVIGLGARFVVWPGWQARASLPETREELNLVNKELSALQARNAAARLGVAAARQAVSDESPRPLSEGGRLVDLLWAACREHHVELQRVDPLVGAAAGNWSVLITAAGEFPALYSVLREVESWSRYITISDLSFSGPPAGTNGPAEAHWTIHVRWTPDSPAGARP